MKNTYSLTQFNPAHHSEYLDSQTKMERIRKYEPNQQRGNNLTDTFHKLSIESEEIESINLRKKNTTIPWVKKSNRHSDESQFTVLQKWEGYVTSVDKENKEFSATICDVINEENPDQEVEIQFSEISDFDIPLIKLGAFLYFYIGYEVKAHGQKQRSSLIRFRRLSPWSKQELNRAEKEAYELSQYFSRDKRKKSASKP